MMSFGEVLVAVAFLLGLPGILSFFSYKSKKNKHEIEKIKYQKEILELEIEKEKIKLKTIEEENKKLDTLINNDNIAGLLK